MKLYWDYTEKERSEMTEQQIESLLDSELMSKGVLKVAKPSMAKIEDIKVASETFFAVEGIIFKTAEEAQSFLALNPMRENYDYSIGYDYKYAQEITPEIKQIRLFDRADIANLKSVLSKNNAAKKQNDTLIEQFDKAIKKVNSVLDEVWADWHDCKARASAHQRIVDTRAEYLKLTGENLEMAEQFLKKIFSDEQIEASDIWFNGPRSQAVAV